MATAEPDPLSVAELRAGLEALTAVDYARLNKAATYLAQGTGRNPHALINDAICAAFDGTRMCRRDLPAVIFLIGIMRSNVWWAREQRKAEPGVDSMTTASAERRLAAVRDPGRNPAEMLLAREDFEARLRNLSELFDEDEAALLVLWGEFEGMTAEEIRAQTGMSEKEYATVRRRIRRKIDSAIGPGGWQP